MCWPFCVAHEIRSQVTVVPAHQVGRFGRKWLPSRPLPL
jgi:hypothetical protein